MLKSLFSPKWQHPDVSTRKHAITTLDPHKPKQLKALQAVILEDAQAELRQLAITRIESIELLEQLNDQLREEDKPALEQHWGKLLAAQNQPLPDALPEAVLCSAINEAEPAVALAWLPTLSAAQPLLQIALHHPHTQVRQAATEQISDDALVRQLQKNSNDKHVIRLCKSRLQTLATQKQQRQQTEQAIEQLSQQLQHHSNKTLDALYRAKFSTLQQQWSTLSAQASSQIKTTVENLLAQCQQRIDEQQAQLEELELRTQAAVDQKNACDDLEQILNDLQNHWSDRLSASVSGVISVQQNRWQQSSSLHQPSDDLNTLFQRHLAVLQQLHEAVKTCEQTDIQPLPFIDDEQTAESEDTQAPVHIDHLLEQLQRTQQTLKEINWPASIANSPTVDALVQRRQTLQTKISEHKKLEQQHIQAIKKLKGKLNHLLRQGKLRPANYTWQQIEQHLQPLPSKEQASWQQSLTQQKEELARLQDWAGFATGDKKQQLCEQMEALASTDLAPKQKLEEIKTLQLQWRQLSGFNSTEKSDDENQDNIDLLWQRFQTAGDIAFKPCQDFFAARDELKQFNLEHKESLCEQLQDFVEHTDWQNPNWKHINQILQTARKEWQHYEPIANQEKQATQVINRYQKLTADINGRLKQEKQRNLEQREHLLQQAKDLSAQDDIRQAMDTAKQLQQQWKTLGFTFHKPGQALWEQFREACNQVFQQADEQRNEQRHAVKQTIADAKAIISQIEALCRQPDEDMRETQAKHQKLQDDFDQLAEIPANQHRDLSKHITAANKQFRQHKAGLKLRQRLSSLERLREFSILCSAQEAATQPATAQMESLWEQLAEQRTAQLEKRYQALGSSPSDQAQTDNQQQLELFAIQMEILADSATPEAYRQQRMDYQLQQLSKNARGSKPQEQRFDEFVELEKQWHQIGFTEVKSREQLELRRQHCGAALLKQLTGLS